jgi:hypothetical protein
VHPMDAAVGLSWTRNRDIACWFAMRFSEVSGVRPFVFETYVGPEEIVTFYDGRREAEVIVDTVPLDMNWIMVDGTSIRHDFLEIDSSAPAERLADWSAAAQRHTDSKRMSGHIRRRGKHSWGLKFERGRDPVNGKRLTEYRTFRGTKQQAQAELTKLMASSLAGSYVDPVKLTVAEFLDRWLRDWVEVNNSPKTQQPNTQLVRSYVIPHIGTVPLQKLKPMHIAELYGKLRRESGSIASCAMRYGMPYAGA